MNRRQDDAIWSCKRRKIAEVVTVKLQAAIRVTLKLECGHEIAQDFPARPTYRVGIGDCLNWPRAEQRSGWHAAAAKAAGFSPCLACGPATTVGSRLIDPVGG